MNMLIRNILAAIIVAVVSLPLAASFGILSGRGAFAGMISAAVITLIATSLGGTKIKCSGPTAPMSAVALVVVGFAASPRFSESISPDHFVNMTFIVAGLCIICMGLLRLGKWISYIPNVVVSGFMNGIAMMIWLNQAKLLFGNSDQMLAGSQVHTILLAAFTIFMIVLFPLLFRRAFPVYGHMIPSTVFAVIFATVSAHVFTVDVQMVAMESTFHSWVDVQSYFGSQIPVGITWVAIAHMIPFALQLSVLCYLDTLLTSRIVDRITDTTTKPNQELIAQGLANGVSGLLGGIPGAQETMRSVMIIKEGATKRWSAVMVGVFVLVFMLIFQDMIMLIPQAVFVGMLLKVGYDVFDWKPIRLYCKEIFTDSKGLFHEWMSRHDDQQIYVTNRELMMIVGTTALTVIWDLNAAIFVFTGLFYLINKVICKHNPMRDLKPFVETESFNVKE